MGKVVKYFIVALVAALAALGILHFIKVRKLEKGLLGEGETYEDKEPTGCCGAEFIESQKKKMPKEERVSENTEA